MAAAAAAAAAGAAAEAGDDVPSVLRIDDGSGTTLAIPDEVIEELPQMSVAGDAASTLQGQRSAINSFDRFLKKGVAKYPSGAKFANLPSNLLCCSTIFREFAYFLSNGGVRSTGGAPGGSGGTVLEYLRKVYGQAKVKFGDKHEHAAFFAKADDIGGWLKGLLRQVHVVAFRTANVRGVTPSHQAVPLYLAQRRDVQSGLRREGSRESARRCAVLQLNGVAAGRPSEVAGASTDVMTWDSAARCLVMSWAQIKVHKHKLVLVIAGRDRLACPTLALATAYAPGCFYVQIYDAGTLNYLFPGLASTNAGNSATSSSTTMATWLRQMSRSSTNGTYAPFRAMSLPGDATAGGFRTGGINECAMGGVSPSFMMFTSGHDADAQISRLWHYIGATVPLCMPGARVLCGWPAPPDGRIGRGVVPQSLAPVLAFGIQPPHLERWVHRLLQLRPGFTHPDMLGQDGPLRPFVETMAGALIMYYGESITNAEMPRVTTFMASSLVAEGISVNTADADQRLRQWGSAIKAQFDVDNLELLCPPSAPDMLQVTTALTQQSNTIAAMGLDATRRIATLTSAVESLQNMVGTLMGQMGAMQQQLSARALRSPPHRSAAGADSAVGNAGVEVSEWSEWSE